jgi:hypothetical protein
MHARERKPFSAKLDACDLVPPEGDLGVRQTRLLDAHAQPEDPITGDDDEPVGAWADGAGGAGERTDSLVGPEVTGEAVERLAGLPPRVVRQARDGAIDVGSIRGRRF